LTLTQATLSNPKINVTNRSSGLASKGPVARAPMKTRTSTVMSASLNVGAQSKMRAGGAVAQIGSAKSKMSHVVSAYGKNTTTKASGGQFGSSGSSVQSSRTQLTSSNNVQTKKIQLWTNKHGYSKPQHHELSVKNEKCHHQSFNQQYWLRLLYRWI